MKKFRLENRAFVVEGEKTVIELLATKLKPIQIYATKDFSFPKSMAHFERLTELISPKELERISGYNAPQPVLAVFELPDLTTAPQEQESGCYLVLDRIQDPGNLGTLLRLADWFGLPGVIALPGCADFFNPKTIQASMASVGRVPLFVDEAEELFELWPKQTFLAADTTGQSVYQFSFPKDCALVIGNEARGISPEILSRCRARVSIPAFGHAESLNAAMAAGILISHYQSEHTYS